MGTWYGDITEFEPGKGYVFGPIATGYNFTVAGDVPENEITVPVKAATLTYGQVEVNTIGWNTPLTQCPLSNLIPTATDFDFINWYNTTKATPAYDYAYYFMGTWYGDFDCLEPGKGYVFGPIATGYNLTYNRSEGFN
jgi:hypothetical protein